MSRPNSFKLMRVNEKSIVERQWVFLLIFGDYSSMTWIFFINKKFETFQCLLSLKI